MPFNPKFKIQLQIIFNISSISTIKSVTICEISVKRYTVNSHKISILKLVDKSHVDVITQSQDTSVTNTKTYLFCHQKTHDPKFQTKRLSGNLLIRTSKNAPSIKNGRSSHLRRNMSLNERNIAFITSGSKQPLHFTCNGSVV